MVSQLQSWSQSWGELWSQSGATICRCHDIYGPIQQYLVADTIHCFGGCFCKLLLTVILNAHLILSIIDVIPLN